MGNLNGFKVLPLRSVLCFLIVGVCSTAVFASEFVVKSRAMIHVNSGLGQHSLSNQIPFLNGTSGSQPISVINAPASKMVIDNSNFIIPEITNSLINFGILQISTLSDNNLRVCGDQHNQRCNTALIRAYTTGVAGAGVYNGELGYGAPLEVTRDGGQYQTVGLEQAGAVIVDSLPLDPAKHVLRHNNFAPYHFQADFTDAGAGTYSTTVVIEYGLGL